MSENQTQTMDSNIVTNNETSQCSSDLSLLLSHSGQLEPGIDCTSLLSSLELAYSTYHQNASQRLFYQEIEVPRLAAQALIGRRISVFWEGEQEWFIGVVKSYNSLDKTYDVLYNDGDRADECLLVERFRLLISLEDKIAFEPTVSMLTMHTLELEAVLSRGTGSKDFLARASKKLKHLAALKETIGKRKPLDQVESVCIGDVCWCRNGSSAASMFYPAMVISREALIDILSFVGKAPFIKKKVDSGSYAVPLCFFHTGEIDLVEPDRIVSFERGLEMGYYKKLVRRKMNLLEETRRWLAEGRLSETMTFAHNDDGDVDDSNQEEKEEAHKPGRKRKGGDTDAFTTVCKKGRKAVVSGCKISLSLTIMDIGVIEWIHPGYHSPRHIFPAGYSVARISSTPASKGLRVVHTCEIEKGEFGPVFKVTPQGFKTVKGNTADEAWAALFHGVDPPVVLPKDKGVNKFGLSDTAVKRWIESLPHAERCHQYAGWPESHLSAGGDASTYPLTTEEQQERDECARRMLIHRAETQQLPKGVTGFAFKPCHRLNVDGIQLSHACQVCGEEEEDEEDHLVMCDGCRLFVHMSCYGISKLPDGSPWRCDLCELGLSKRPPACLLCPIKGGLMKPTTCGRWCHSVCGSWLPEPVLQPNLKVGTLTGMIDRIDFIHSSRFKQRCCVCQETHGAVVQCCAINCGSLMHASCAQQSERISWKMVGDYSDDEDGTVTPSAHTKSASKKVGGPGATTTQKKKTSSKNRRESGGGEKEKVHPKTGPYGCSRCRYTPNGCLGCNPAKAKPDKKNNKRAPLLPVAQCPKKIGESDKIVQQSHGASSSSSSSSSKRTFTQRTDEEITSTPGSNKRWSQGAVPPPSKADYAVTVSTPSYTKQERKRGVLVGQGVRLLTFCPRHARRMYDSVAPSLEVSPNKIDPALERALDNNTKLRLVRAARKLLPDDDGNDDVGACTPGGSSGVKQSIAAHSSARAIAYDHASRRGQKAPEAEAAAREKRKFVRALPLKPGGARQQKFGIPPSWSRILETVPGHGDDGALTVVREIASPYRKMNAMGTFNRPPSASERYLNMRATLPTRLAPGKSAIHGWGMFAIQGHSMHDMVIEYAGQLVRPSVSDMREKKLYNGMVGAGTYIFSLNSTFHVDATRTGNLAHLINHSCDPNCYSRTITITNMKGKKGDHVIIFAKRHIKPMEELTYDYRFAGEEILPCNCGAEKCRGMVNATMLPPVVDARGRFVPSHKVELITSRQLLEECASQSTTQHAAYSVALSEPDSKEALCSNKEAET